MKKGREGEKGEEGRKKGKIHVLLAAKHEDPDAGKD